MSKNSKTKQGMASIYIVVFTTMLISIITLSFLRIMLSESGRTTKDTLSDSAYNSALAGVEDAKTVYALYQKALAGDPSIPDTVKTYLERADANEDCDVIRKALGEPGSDEYAIDGNISDQAYTCVTMSLEGDFAGWITKDKPVLVVPLRSKESMASGGNANGIKSVKITWHNYNANSSALSSFDKYGYGSNLSSADDITRSIVNGKDLAKRPNGIFGSKGMNNDDDSVDLNALNVMLVQSAKGDSNPNYYSSQQISGSYYRTNRAYLTLVPYQDDDESAHNNTISQMELGLSADKTINQPHPVYCDTTDEASCEVTIRLPGQIGGGDRDPENFFLVLNKVYSDPDLDVTVKMYDTYGNEIKFWNVQPIVDATGRAGDLMRRVEARLGTDNGASLLPTAELSIEGDINKNFYVTKNCIKGVQECDDSGAL